MFKHQYNGPAYGGTVRYIAMDAVTTSSGTPGKPGIRMYYAGPVSWVPNQNHWL